MPSRRRLLAAGGLAAAGLVGAISTAPGSVRPRSTAGARSQSSIDEFDWPMARYDAAGTGHNPAASGPTDGVQVRWKRELDASVRGSAAVICADGTLFVVGRRSLVALDAGTGRVRFTRSGSYQSSPAHAKASAYRTDTLAVTSREGIYGLNAGGGYELAGVSVGVERWHAPGDAPGYRTSANPREPSPVAVDGTVYAAVPETGRLIAIDASSGRTEWEYVSTDLPMGDPHRPAVRDGTVYVSGWPTTVAALDAETGEQRWAVGLDHPDVLAPTATEAGVVVPGWDTVSLLDPTDGSVLWEYDHDGNATEGSAAVADGAVFLTDGDGSLHAVDLDSGEELWTAEYGLQVEPVVADGVVYLGSFWYPELVAFDAESGEQRWSYDEDTGFSQPVVGDGVLYAVGNEKIVALEEAD
ncbi:PQQ-binding-like beta-propeller repeat protein [Natrialbaceae archaeon A-arb3/5]